MTDAGTTTDAEVRTATVDDVDAVRSVATAAWTDAYDDLLADETVEAALAEWYDPAALRGLVAAEDVHYFVAVDGDEVVGFASGGPVDQHDRQEAGERDEDGGEETGGRDDGGDRRAARLAAIYVLPERRGEGVGTALLERFEAAVRAAGCDVVRLEALAGNELAASFYRSRGFEAVGEESAELFGERVPETEFRKRLS